MTQCQFTCSYFDYEEGKEITYKCLEDENDEVLDSGLCIFHDRSYLSNENNRKDREQKLIDKLNDKLRESIEQGKTIHWIGYHFPDVYFGLSFSKPVYFSNCEFHGKADFSKAEFQQGVDFSDAKFEGIAKFYGTSFGGMKLNKIKNFLRQELELENESVEHFKFKFDKFTTENLSKNKGLNADFRGAIFEELADFTAANFEADAEFFRTKFRGFAKFFMTKFLMTTESMKDIFGDEKEKADLLRNYYRVKAYFYSDDPETHQTTHFEKLADFTFATFEDVSFSGTTFAKEVIFLETIVTGNASFISAEFNGDAKFMNTSFHKRTEFYDTIFKEKAVFDTTIFLDEAYFIRTIFSNSAFFSGEFKTQAYFNYTSFEQPTKVVIENGGMSNVSFSNTDITRIRFGDKIKWGGSDGYTIFEEQSLLKYLEERKENNSNNVSTEKENESNNQLSLELVLSVYRNLRENYEFRLRYDEAGKFFTKEMEVKRKYREVSRPSDRKIKLIKSFRVKGNNDPIEQGGLEKNNFFRTHFSLTGLYYHLSTYGESILKPVIIGIIIVGLSTAFWLVENNPEGGPSLNFISDMNTSSNFVNITQVWNNTHMLRAFDRSLADFLPLLSMPSDVKVGILDFVVKIVGGGLTFVLLGVALRRKFERKYTR